MGTFFKGTSELNESNYVTITNSGTGGSQRYTIYTNTSTDDFVMIKLHGLAIGAGGNFNVLSLNLLLDQQNFETTSWVELLYLPLGISGVTGSDTLMPVAMTTPNLRTFQRLNRSWGTAPEINAYGTATTPAIFDALTWGMPYFILWPKERVRIETSINLISGSSNVNFQYSTHIIRKVG